jgi:hypothetical protein
MVAVHRETRALRRRRDYYSGTLGLSTVARTTALAMHGKRNLSRDTARAMSKQNVEAFKRGLEAGNRGDVDALLDELHPEIEWHSALHARGVRALEGSYGAGGRAIAPRSTPNGSQSSPLP